MQTNLLSDAILAQRPINATAAGTTLITGATVDLQANPGCLGVLFIACLGTLTATQTTALKMQVSDDNSTWVDAYHVDAEQPSTQIITANAADADSNKLLILDVLRPNHRYVRPAIVRGVANAVIDAVIALPYHARTMPTTFLAANVSQSSKWIDAT